MRFCKSQRNTKKRKKTLFWISFLRAAIIAIGKKCILLITSNMYQYSPCHCDLFSCDNTIVCLNMDEQCMMINDDALSDFYHVYRRTKTWSGHSSHKTETKQFFKKNKIIIIIITCMQTRFTWFLSSHVCTRSFGHASSAY